MKEIAQKEKNGPRGFPILWIKIMSEDFQTEKKECKDQGSLRCEEENSCQWLGDASVWGKQLSLGR